MQAEGGLGTVTGTIIRYGDVATFPWGTEEIKAGAFGNPESEDARVKVNRMHQSDAAPWLALASGLRIHNNSDNHEMRGEVTLPDTSV